MSNSEWLVREATPLDMPAVTELVLVHGQNEWNYLPEDEVHRHVDGLDSGKTHAVVAETDSGLVGVVTYEIGQFYPQYQPAGKKRINHGYIAEAAVHKSFVGQGIGTTLCGRAIQLLIDNHGVKEVYAMRHADNISSGTMMDKSSMEVIDEFDDPDRRPSGSRRTVVTRYTAPY